jgi:hypothetical protein
MRGYSEGMGGRYMEKVLRIAPVAALVVLVAAGCGSSSRPRDLTEHGLPRTLAHTWAAQASAIADAAAAGDGCGARRLAGSLRTEVISAGGVVPARLRTPLLGAVNSLANRIVCVVPPLTVTNPPPPESKPKGHRGHGHHDHHGHGGGDQRNQP